MSATTTEAGATTIAAISSPPGPALRGIVRISGPGTADVLGRALVGSDASSWEHTARGVFPARFDDGIGTQPALVFWMPGPHSYTREDVAELHLPGAPPLLDAALARVLELGAAAAAPGEFTRRAFLNGRIDLTRAEGVLELVQATNESERRAAMHLLEGGLDRRMAGLRDALDDLRGLCEASLDFDESDTGHVPEAELSAWMDAIGARLDEALAWEVARQPANALPRILLFGAPNAGKSTLFNALAPEGRALVSDLSGTTRDALAVCIEVAGSPCLLLDTPGLDPDALRVAGPDASAQRLAERERGGADLILWLVAADGTPEARRTEAAALAALPSATRVLRVWSKGDLGARPADDDGRIETAVPAQGPASGLEALHAAIANALGLEGASDAPGAPAAGLQRELFARHRDALVSARREVACAAREIACGTSLDLVAETLRGASHALDRITGRTGAEDLLDRIFARFCIGK